MQLKYLGFEPLVSLVSSTKKNSSRMYSFGGNHNLESEQRTKLRKDAFSGQSSTFRDKPTLGRERRENELMHDSTGISNFQLHLRE